MVPPIEFRILRTFSLQSALFWSVIYWILMKKYVCIQYICVLFTDKFDSCYIHLGAILKKTFSHLFLPFKPLSFILARWRWLPDCCTVLEEGVWQPGDFRPEVLGWWEVYLCSQSPAENQVQRKGCRESEVFTVCNHHMCSVNQFQRNSSTILFCRIVRLSIIETQNQHKKSFCCAVVMTANTLSHLSLIMNFIYVLNPFFFYI